MNKIFITVLFCLLNYGTSAQTPYLKHYTDADGLPGSMIYKIVSDKDNFIWLYTNNGINRFNGFEFSNYTLSKGFPSHGAITGGTDYKGRLWFITFKDSACYYDSHEFHRFVTPYNVSWIIFVHEDIYFLTTNGHLLWYKNDQLFKDIYVCPTKLMSGCSVSGNTLLVYSSLSGAYLVTENVVKHIMAARHSTFMRFYKLRNGDILVSNFDGIYELRNDKLIMVHPFLRKKTNAYEYFDIQDDKQGLLLCTSDGLFKCRDKYNIATAKPIYTKSPVTSLIKDIDGNYWFSTYSDGLYSFRLNDNLNQTFYNESIVKAISGHNDKAVYFFCENGEIKKWIKGKSLKRVARCQATIKSAMRTNNGFIVRCNSGTNYSFVKERLKRMPFSIFSYSLFDSSLYTFSKGFIRIRDSSIQEILPPLTGNEETLYTKKFGSLVTRAFVVQGDTLWLGNEFGLLRLTRGLMEKPFSNDVLKAYVADIKIDRNGTIWVATKGNGIYYIDKNRLYIPENKILRMLTCNEVFIDDDNNVWVASQEGLYKIIRQDDTLNIRSFNYRTLLSNSEVVSVFKTGNTIFVSTNLGVNIFDERIASLEQPIPSTFINGMSVNNNNVIPSMPMNFKYNENNIHFDFTSLDYSCIKKPSYYYCLKGTDSFWIHTEQSSIDFSYLYPGTYTFYVSAENMDGTGSRNPAKISFTINPPLWQTWWFYCFCTACFLATITLIFRYYKITNERRRLHIEAELKALRAQMNPHFIFNSLNAMQDFILQNDSAKANEYLVKFASLMRGILENSRKQTISLFHELRFLELYLEIESLRFEDKFRYHIQVDADINTMRTFIPSMVLQPFIENAIIHGLAQKKSNGMINLEVKKKDANTVLCIIEDNGIGRRNSYSKVYERTGILNTENRLRLLNNIPKGNVIITDLKDSEGNATGTRVAVLIHINRKIINEQKFERI